jgi:hypothetical protein
MTNLSTGQREMDLIVVKELLDFLNNGTEAIQRQKAKYDE